MNKQILLVKWKFHLIKIIFPIKLKQVNLIYK